MKGDVEVPKPSAEERALQAEQTELLRTQRELILQGQQQQQMLFPILAEQMGLAVKFDASGNIISAAQTPESKRMEDLGTQVLEKTLADLLREDPLQARQEKILDLQLRQLEEEMDPTTPEGMRNKEIETLLGERTLKALRGELEIDPALERDIAKQGDTLRDRLRSQFGPGWETSSPGIEAMQAYEEGANVLRHQARKGELTLSEQLSMARTGADIALGGQSLSASQMKIPGIDPLASGGFAFGMNQGTKQGQISLAQLLGGVTSGTAGGMGQVAAGFQMPIGQMMQQREMEFSANMQNAKNDMMGLGALGSVFGSVLGMLPFSDARLKSKLVPIGDWRGIPIYVYSIGGKRKVGVMAQDLVGIQEEAIGQIGEWLTVKYGELV